MIRLLLLLATLSLAPWLADRATAQHAPGSSGRTLQPFGSMEELVELHRRLDREEAQWRASQPPEPSVITETDYAYYMSLVPPPDPLGTPRQRERPIPRENPGSAVGQTGGDERAVAKVQGDYLVGLHRGRLFTVRIGGGALQPVSAVDAFGPHVDHLAGWHDELLVSGDRVVVIGDNQRLSGTELGVFHLAPDGRLTYRATYYLPTADYTGSHTYAARLDGDRLVFYAPLRMRGTVPPAHTPVLYRWGADSSRVHTTVPPTRLYRPAEPVTWRDRYRMQLHTVLACDLAGDDLRCDATGVYALPGSMYHVSATSVYVWTTRPGAGSVLYRLPLDGSAPTALRVSGRPVDPFSFLESGDEHLNVLVNPDESSPQAWGAAYTVGAPALLRVPLSALGDGSGAAAPGQYHPLPAPGLGVIHNRFVGDWLVYGVGAGPGESALASTEAFAVRWAAEHDTVRLALPHDVDRIEAMGPGAVLIGTDGTDLHLSTLRLGPGAPVLAHRYTLPGETRSHGFFYHPDGEHAGVLGLPVRSTERPEYTGTAAYPGMSEPPGGPPLFLGPTRIRFLRSRDLRLGDAGELAAGAPAGDDGCMAGCGLWYGNARPVFAGGRTFALLGYELVEGRETGGGFREARRVGFAPAPPTAGISGDWTFNETVGLSSRYHCSNRGTMRFDREGGALTMRYRQTGECTIGGVTTKSDGEGSGTGTVGPDFLNLKVGDCQSTGWMKSSHSIDGTIRCRVAMPDGTTTEVDGYWWARRPPT